MLVLRCLSRFVPYVRKRRSAVSQATANTVSSAWCVFCLIPGSRRRSAHDMRSLNVSSSNPTDSATRNENVFLFAQPDITAEFPSTGGTDANYTSAKFYESRLYG